MNTQEFLAQSISHLEANTPRIKKCLDLLDDEAVWKRPNASSNSIGNLILHLCGNITQYIISSLGGRKDERNRDAEFAAKEGYTKDELYDKLYRTVTAATAVIYAQHEDNLEKVHSVQGFQLSGIGIIIHVVEHYSYHTGQIAFWTKLLLDKDLGFYAGQDLNAKNEL